MAGVLAINVEKLLRREPSSDGRKGNPHEKLHIRLREMFGLSSRDEQFEGIIRNARKNGILHGTTLWSLVALKWARGACHVV